MTEKELKQLSKYELLDLLEEYSRANAELKLQLENKDEKRKQLFKRFEEELMEEHKKLLMVGREMKRLEEENKELKERLQEREQQNAGDYMLQAQLGNQKSADSRMLEQPAEQQSTDSRLQEQPADQQNTAPQHAQPLGNIAEETVKISGIFEAAQKTAELYLEKVKKMGAQTEQECSALQKKTEQECNALQEKTEQECSELRENTKQECNTLREETRTACETWKLDVQRYYTQLKENTENYCNQYKVQVEIYCSQQKAKTENYCNQLKGETESYCDQQKAKTENYCNQLKAETENYCDQQKAEAEQYCSELQRKTKEEDAQIQDEEARSQELSWEAFSTKMEEFYAAHEGMKELLGESGMKIPSFLQNDLD